MTTDALLVLAQWFSPGFPVGAFAYSHGLERIIDQGAMQDVHTLELWLRDLLAHGSGRADAVLVAAAFRADRTDIAAIDATARAFAASAGRLLETVQQGGAFARTVDAVWDMRMGPLTYPVAVGHAAALRDLPLEATVRLYLHAFCANLVSAAVRLVPLGQTEGQALLARLSPLIGDVTTEALETRSDDLCAHCFAADIASMQHEIQHSKVFRT